MVSTKALRRAISAGVAAVALTIAGVGLSAGAADAADRSPWDAIAQCESGGNWSINTGNGYYGGLQFNSSTWSAYGGRGSAATASKAEQIRIGRRVVAGQGWGAWSSCSARLGLHGRVALPDSSKHTRYARQTAGRAAGEVSLKAGDAKRRAHLRASRIAAAKVPTCSAKTLKARFVDGGSTAGTRHADLRLTNTGAQRCRLDKAPRAVFLRAGAHARRVGATGVYHFQTVRPATPASKRSRFILAAHSGHVYSRIAVASTAGRGKRCKPVEVTSLVAVVRRGSGRVDASVSGLHLQTCQNAGAEVLRFGQYRPHRSTVRR